MRTTPVQATPIAITPGVTVADEAAATWVAQVTLRLRRETGWCWHQRAGRPDEGGGKLPPVTDPAQENLDLVRYENEKWRFFKTDVAAAYLTEQIARLQPMSSTSNVRGSWTWLAKTLALDRAAQFVLALGLVARLDAGVSPIFATCMNDFARPYPTLALAQRLWDDPLAVVACADPANALYRYGLLSMPGEPNRGMDWHRPLEVHSLIAQTLLDPGSLLPSGLEPLEADQERSLDRNGAVLAARLNGEQIDSMQVVPLIGPKGIHFAAWAATFAYRTGRTVVRVSNDHPLDENAFVALASVCWMRGLDILMPPDWLHGAAHHDRAHTLSRAWSVPVRCYLPMSDQSRLSQLPSFIITPPLKISGLTFNERVAALRQGLADCTADLQETIEECARRFRFQEEAIAHISKTFASTTTLGAEDLFAACRNEAAFELGGLAQYVTPRFGIDELVLPAAQIQQFKEILQAMRNLTRVHYGWGTARVWNESGLSVLFCGPPGTGKTMSAEVLSSVLDLPMYRIDLSQVINKYIGETEKNLKRIFDAAELSDCILFFDEADALFGKRTEVKDAHDRFANIEISYLLERMERFKGLAILATNRRKDLDEAFMRRLRYILEFPLPGPQERERIWRQVFPERVDVSEIDFPYLAKQFQLSGGHIRSIAFNACLLSADADEEGISSRLDGAVGKISLKHLLVAVKRELEKMNRVASEELFGVYGAMMRETMG